MDYFQGVVTEYLRADRTMFVNTEYLIQLDPGNVPAKGRHWYCDAVAANHRKKTVYLCEVTYSATLDALISRLIGWSRHWIDLRTALQRDSAIPENWNVVPWLFIPENRHPVLKKKLASRLTFDGSPGAMPEPQIKYLEKVTPWHYRSWDRREDEPEQPEVKLSDD